MNAIEKVLVQQTHLDIFNCGKGPSVDIKGWIANQNYLVGNVCSASSFSLRAGSDRRLKNALANDCNRMAMASVECVCGIKKDSILKKSGAWGIIRLYYASFFAAHSILRMFGRSCTYIEQVYASKINDIIKHLGGSTCSNKIEKGFYLIDIDNGYHDVGFKKLKDTHGDTWNCFLRLLDKLIDDSENAAAIRPHREEAILMLMQIKKGITHASGRGKGNWLSIIRNSINYQHSHGVWYPYERKTTAVRRINNIQSDWIKPIDHTGLHFDSRNDIEHFFELCLLVIRLFRELILGCIKKINSDKSIFMAGSYRLLQTIKAA